MNRVSRIKKNIDSVVASTIQSGWFGLLLLIASIFVTVWWKFHLPPPGYAVGLIAVIAALLTLRDNEPLEKVAFAITLAVLLRTEFQAISEDRDQSQQDLNSRLAEFRTIEGGLSKTNLDMQSNFAVSAQKSADILGATNKAKQGIEEAAHQLSGGKSFAYVIPQNFAGSNYFSAMIQNGGDALLSGLTVYPEVAKCISKNLAEDCLNKYDPVKSGTMQIGTLAPRAHANLFEFNFEPHAGNLTYRFIINAQNGRVVEDVFLRPSTSVIGYDYRIEVHREPPTVYDPSGKTYRPLELVKSIPWTQPIPTYNKLFGLQSEKK